MKTYATFETFPCVFDDREGWVLFESEWRQLNLAEIKQVAKPMTEANFRARFPQLIAMPSAAFQAAE